MNKESRVPFVYSFNYHFAVNQGVILGEISCLPFVTKDLRNQEMFLGRIAFSESHRNLL